MLALTELSLVRHDPFDDGAPALDGLEIVQLCLYAELPLSAVMDAEEGQ